MVEKDTYGFAEESKKSILRHHHAFIITITNTFCQLLFKCLPAFIAFIIIDYGFSYQFIAIALSIGSLSTALSFILNPLILYLPTNVVFSILCVLQSFGCFILWYFRDSKLFFILGVIILSLTENVAFGCSNTVIVSFTTDSNISHKYLSALNGAWTFATFLFFGVGYLMKIGSMWLVLEVMFFSFIIIGILNLCLLPNLSTNKYNLIRSNANLPKESQVSVSIKNDMAVLSRITPFWLIIGMLLFTFTCWGYFYSTFGLWLKELFNLNQAQFGYIAGLSEGFGNLCGILTVTYFSKSEDHANESKINDKWYKMSLQSMVLLTGAIMMVSMVIIFICCFVEWYNEYFLFAMVGVYFYGQEACICAAFILMVNVVPPLQQGRSSSFIGIIQSITLFVSQSTVATIYRQFDGMKWESFLLVNIYLLAILVMIFLRKSMNDTKYLDDELIPININRDGQKNPIHQYTV